MNLANAAGPPTTRSACSKAVSLFLGTNELKHYFPGYVKHCLTRGRARTLQRMENKKTAPRLAELIREAMDSKTPKVTATELAKACGVTPQAVSGWRKNGRVDKKHLQTIADLTGRNTSHFLALGQKNGAKNGVQTHQDEFQTVVRAWHNASSDQKAILLGAAKSILERNAQRRKRAS